jgi:hypothetical protein
MQQRDRLLSRQTPVELVGELGAARRTLGGMPVRSGSQLGEAAAAEEVPVATLVHVGGGCVQTHDADQVIWGFWVLLFLAPPGSRGGGGGGGAHAAMEGQHGGTVHMEVRVASARAGVGGGRAVCGGRERRKKRFQRISKDFGRVRSVESCVE